MTPAEFKAWFDGFTEAFSGCPTKAQWTRIKERVSEIDGRPVTERHFVDRYWPRFSDTITYYSVSGVGAANLPISCSNTTLSATAVGDFSSTSAMFALGKAEALAA